MQEISQYWSALWSFFSDKKYCSFKRVKIGPMWNLLLEAVRWIELLFIQQEAVNIKINGLSGLENVCLLFSCWEKKPFLDFLAFFFSIQATTGWLPKSCILFCDLIWENIAIWIKFSFSEKATKIWAIRKAELYLPAKHNI